MRTLLALVAGLGVVMLSIVMTLLGAAITVWLGHWALEFMGVW